MTHDVRFARSALIDVAAITRWIGERAGPDVARGYLDRIEDRARSIGDLPNIGARLGRSGIRSLPFERSAIIIFRVSDQLVEIRRVVRRGRKLDKMLG